MYTHIFWSIVQNIFGGKPTNDNYFEGSDGENNSNLVHGTNLSINEVFELSCY